MNFYQRKEQRRLYYEKYAKGWKTVPCSACSGSGYYDNTGSPKCGCCDGSGKMKISPEHYKERQKWIKKQRYIC